MRGFLRSSLLRSVLAALAGILIGGFVVTQTSTAPNAEEVLIARLIHVEAELQKLNGALDTTRDATHTRLQELRDQQTGLSGFYGELLDGVDGLRKALANQRERAEPVLQRAERVLDVLSVDRRGDVVIEHANLVVRNGRGATDMADGKGNIVIGYNEHANRGNTQRSGSHNLVVGSGHSYTSYGSLVAGYENAVSAPFAAVVGGHDVMVNAVAGVFAGDGDLGREDAGTATAARTPATQAASRQIARHDRPQADGQDDQRQAVLALMAGQTSVAQVADRLKVPTREVVRWLETARAGINHALRAPAPSDLPRKEQVAASDGTGLAAARPAGRMVAARDLGVQHATDNPR